MNRLNLYWCATCDGNERWFIIEPTAGRARAVFAALKGYDDGDVIARLILTLPEELQSRDARLLGSPTEDVLEVCGARFGRRESPRSLTLNGEMFIEG